MKTKTFKIGECCIGGIIKITITGKVIEISILDWYSKTVLHKSTVSSDDDGAFWKIKDFLNEMTSSYYTNKCMDWITANNNIKKELFRF